MLILSRRPGEVVHLHTSDGIIVIRLYDCNDRLARLGFTAPQSVEILRAEIDDTEEGSNQAGAIRPLALPQRKTILSLLRELVTRWSAGRH
jgi:carbon storage regulator